MSLEKKHTLRELLCRGVQSVFLAAEITVLADLLFAAGETPLPRAAFWGLFLAAAAALSLPYMPNTAEPVPVITAPSAPRSRSALFISATAFMRRSSTFSKTLYMRRQSCGRSLVFRAATMPAVSG